MRRCLKKWQIGYTSGQLLGNVIMFSKPFVFLPCNENNKQKLENNNQTLFFFSSKNYIFHRAAKNQVREGQTPVCSATGGVPHSKLFNINTQTKNPGKIKLKSNIYSIVPYIASTFSNVLDFLTVIIHVPFLSPNQLSAVKVSPLIVRIRRPLGAVVQSLFISQGLHLPTPQGGLLFCITVLNTLIAQ